MDGIAGRLSASFKIALWLAAKKTLKLHRHNYGLLLSPCY
jgi:hypothetical protein